MDVERYNGRERLVIRCRSILVPLALPAPHFPRGGPEYQPIEAMSDVITADVYNERIEFSDGIVEGVHRWM